MPLLSDTDQISTKFATEIMLMIFGLDPGRRRGDSGENADRPGPLLFMSNIVCEIAGLQRSQAPARTSVVIRTIDKCCRRKLNLRSMPHAHPTLHTNAVLPSSNFRI